MAAGSQPASRWLKWLSLSLLVAQTVSVVLAMRLSRSQQVEGPRYLNTTAVFCSEVLKLVCSALFLCIEEGGLQGASLALGAMFTEFSTEPAKAVQVCLPSLLYTLQNNLLFVSLSNLSGAVYQVMYQLKILTTAVLSVLLLGRTLGPTKWVSLAMLTAGAALVQYPRGPGSAAAAAAAGAQGNASVGVVAVLTACATSGLAGVTLERLLKQKGAASLWLRNVQLAFFGALLALAAALWHDGPQIRQHGFLQGYSGLVWAVIWLQAVGGLIVAAVLRYADNLLKCFANAISIVLTCFLSTLLREFEPDLLFLLGTSLVLAASTLYSLGLPQWKKTV